VSDLDIRALEPETEDLLLRLVPGLAAQWQGASATEIDRIEALAGRPLPRFYRWFLLRMGRSMGPLQFRSLDCSASAVLSCYAQGIFDPHPRFLMIGCQTDDMMPLSLFYDFDHPARDDARVANLSPAGSTQLFPYETFREKLALGEFLVSRIETLPQICRGSFKSESGGVLRQLDPLMARAGFTKPIPTGPNCALYERADASLSVSDAQMSIDAVSPYPPADEQAFDLGGADASALQGILAAVADQSALEVTIKSWTPPLRAPLTAP
jgi:hypothetical protein